MRIGLELSALKRTRWYEYALRFFFGGAVTVAAGLIAKGYGPVFGGLFLAFPAIFPATATLVQKHETEKKRKAGIIDDARGRKAAALEARGTALGAIGLICFSLALWRLFLLWNAALSLLVGLAIWLAMVLLLWRVRKVAHRPSTPISAR